MVEYLGPLVKLAGLRVYSEDKIMSSQALAAGLASFGTNMGQGFENFT